MQGISVVIPVHNAGDYLSAAINSILQQTHLNLQCLLVNDHSTDNAIDRLPRNDKRLEVINSDGKGIVSALNTGIQLSKFNFIARMDADDIAHPKRLENQLALLENNPEIDICGCKVEMFSDDFKIAEGYHLYQQWINSLTTPEEIASSIFIESPIPHPSALIRKSVFEKLEGYHDTPWPEDYDLWLRAHKLGLKFAKPEGILLKWRDHSQRLSRQDQRYNKEQFINCKAHHFASIYNQSYKDKPCLIWGTGPTGLMLHDALTQHDIPITGFIDIAKKMIGRNKRNKPVIDAYQLKPSNELILTAVSARGAREEIDQFLKKRKFASIEHYIHFA